MIGRHVCFRQRSVESFVWPRRGERVERSRQLRGEVDLWLVPMRSATLAAAYTSLQEVTLDMACPYSQNVQNLPLLSTLPQLHTDIASPRNTNNHSHWKCPIPAYRTSRPALRLFSYCFPACLHHHHLNACSYRIKLQLQT